MRPHRIYQRGKQLAGGSDPSCKSRAIKLHALSRINLRLAIQRTMIRILRDQHMREQAGSSQSTCDRPRWRWRFDDRLTLAAAKLRAHMPDHPEALRDVIQLLGNVFSEMAKIAAALRAAPLHRLVRDDLARQMLRQWLARKDRNNVIRLRVAVCRRRKRRVDGLHLFQLKFELVELQRELLALPPEEHAAQLLHHQLQMFDLLCMRGQFGLML